MVMKNLITINYKCKKYHKYVKTSKIKCNALFVKFFKYFLSKTYFNKF